MFKNKQLAFQALYIVRDISHLVFRLLKVIRESDMAEEDRTACLFFVHKTFMDPIVSIISQLNSDHPETVLKDSEITPREGFGA